MSVTEIKAEAARLSVEELADLSRFFREQALRKDPKRRAQIKQALGSSTWIVREDFEKRVAAKDNPRRSR